MHAQNANVRRAESAYGFVSRPLIVASAVAAALSIGIVVTVVQRTKSAGDRRVASPDGKSVCAAADPASNKAQFEAYLKKVQDKKEAEQIFKDVVLPDRHEFDQEAVALAEKEFAANSHPLQAVPGSTTMAEAEARERQWWRELYVESYRKYGSQNPQWDKPAMEFLSACGDAFAKGYLEASTAEELAKTGMPLVQAGCDDPLVQFVCGLLVSKYDRQNDQKLIPQAFARFPATRYPLDVVLRLTLPMATREHWSQVIYAFRQKSQELGKNGLLGSDPATARSALLKLCQRTVPWAEYNEVREFLIAVYGTLQFDPWLRAMLTGRYFSELSKGTIDLEAFQPRRKKGVRVRRKPAQLYELQYRHVWTAQTYYLDAWKLHPHQPEAALEILRTAQWRSSLAHRYEDFPDLSFPHHEGNASGLNGKSLPEASRFWFSQVVRARFDHLEAYDQMMVTLWIQGNREGVERLVTNVLAFGRECLATARFDTQVPNFFLNALRYVETNVHHRGYYGQKGVYEDCQKLIAGYSAVAKTESEKDTLKSRLACLAIHSLHNDEAKRLLAELGDKVDAVEFDAQNVNLHDVKKLLLEKHPNQRLFPGLEAVFGVTFAGNDDTVVTAEGNPRLTRIWNVKSGSAVASFLQEDDVAADVAASPDGSLIATTGSKGIVWLWSAQTGKMLRSLDHEAQVRIMAFSPRGDVLATSTGAGEGNGGTVRVWEVASGKELARRTSSIARFHSLAFTPDGKTLAVAGGSFLSPLRSAPGEIVLWNFEQDRPDPPLELFQGSTLGVAVSPDGRRLAALGQGYEFDETRGQSSPAELALVDLPGGTNVRRWRLPLGILNPVFLGTGETMATAGPDLAIRVWNCADARLIAEFTGHRFPITVLASSPQGTRLISRDESGAIKIWNTSGAATESQVQCELLELPIGNPIRIYVDPNWRYVATGDQNLGVVFWDRNSNWNAAAVFPVHDQLRAADFDISPDGKTIVIVGGTVPERVPGAAGKHSGVIQIWDIPSRKLLKTLEDNLQTVWCVRFSPDGRMIATGSDDQRVVVWNAATGKPFDWGNLKEHTGPIARVEFSPDGKLLASGDRQRSGTAKGTVKIWRLPADPQATGIRLTSQQTLAEFSPAGELTMRFSPDGKSLLVFDPKKGRLYDTTTWKKKLELKGAKGEFSIDGKQLITTSDQYIRRWQMGVNQLPQESKLSSAGTWTALTPTPDGRHFLAVNRKLGRVVLWDAASQSLTEAFPEFITKSPKRP